MSLNSTRGFQYAGPKTYPQVKAPWGYQFLTNNAENVESKNPMSDFSAHYMPMYQPALKTTQEQRSFTKVPTSQPVFLPPKLTGKTQSSWSQLKTWLIELLTEEGTDERPIGITALERYRLPTGQLKESLPSNPFIANMTIKTDYRFMNGKF